MNEIGIFNQTNEQIEELNRMKELMEYSLEYENIENVLFNIILVNNEKIQVINREYRGIDRPTDVISFALEDKMFPSAIDEPRMLGDIYISLDKAREQANEYGHSFKRELFFLAVHGLLHLLRYDHMNEEEEKIMFEKQEKILSSFGIER